MYGWFAQNEATAKNIFDARLQPLKEYRVRRNVVEGVGSTYHLGLIAAGVPGFNPIEDHRNCAVRTHVR